MRTTPESRRGTIAAIAGDSQLSIQIRSAPGPAVYFLGETWLGTILLQSCTSGARRSNAQESASLHRNEPNRFKFRTTDSSSKSLYISIYFTYLFLLFIFALYMPII